MQNYSKMIKVCGIDQMSNEEIFKEFSDLMKNDDNEKPEFIERA